MNYISYIKKQGFKKCKPFSITNSYNKNQKYYTEYQTNKYFVDENGELIRNKYDTNIIVVNGFKMKEIDRNGDINVTELHRWYHLKYTKYLNEFNLYVLIHKKEYEIVLTDDKFSFISVNNYPLRNLDNGLFDLNLKQTIGIYIFREYTMNKLIK